MRAEKVAREGPVHSSGSGKPALRQGGWVFITAASGQDNSKAAGEPPWFRKDGGCTDHQQPFELYNLRDDLAQKNNLSAEQTERAQAMMASLERFRSEGRSVPRREMNKK